MTKQSVKAALVETLKKMLGADASVELLKEVNPELLKQLTKGKSVPIIAELIVDKVIRVALDPKKGGQWAIELIWAYCEGKPTQGVAIRDDGRQIEARLDAVTKDHLNSIAAQYGKVPPPPPSDSIERPSPEAPGPADKLLTLSRADQATAGSALTRGPKMKARNADKNSNIPGVVSKAG